MSLLRPALVRLATLAAVITLAACGSTVPVTGAAPSGEQGLGLAPGAATVDAGDGPATLADGTAPGPAPLPGELPAEGNTADGSAAAGSTTAGLPVDELPVEPGGTSKLPPIQIGTYYLDGGTEALGAQGIGLEIPNNKPLFDEMVKYLNDRGGLAGRKIDPVYYKYGYGSDPQTQDAAACAQFTQDNDVYLVIGGINSGAGQLDECLIQHGVPLIGSNGGGDARYFAKNRRYIYEPGQANFTTGLSTLVADLKRNGFFEADSVVGLVQYEGPVYDNAVDDGLVPALSRLGLTLKERVRIPCCDNSVLASGSANAQLKFRTSDVDRVIFMAPGGAVANYFMQAASGQGYQPQYGIWSADSPYVLALVAPKDQLRLASGIGYQPGLDVAAEQDPTATTPAAKACLAFWEKRGESDRSGLNNGLKRATCDIFNTLLLAVADNPDATTSTAVLEAGYNAIGGSYSPAATFAMRFVPASHDAANGYRRLIYKTDCSCFVYVGNTRQIR